jgi:hypothetical protein
MLFKAKSALKMGIVENNKKIMIKMIFGIKAILISIFK